IITDLARSDNDETVRLAAIAQLRDVDVLQAFSADSAETIRQAATAQLRRVISGAVPSVLTPDQRLAMMQQTTDKDALLQMVLECGCDDVGLATLQRLRDEFSIDEAQLADIAAHSTNHTLR